ncbi:hypothetical protein ACCO45_000779 [Purpureocillium lilacinum]|uniref:Uncharacterized protein n=1 Tax=Purpureocillium lilacinum TaxID=33203 RepID=A0ACC4E560_PURLI
MHIWKQTVTARPRQPFQHPIRASCIQDKINFDESFVAEMIPILQASSRPHRPFPFTPPTCHALPPLFLFQDAYPDHRGMGLLPLPLQDGNQGDHEAECAVGGLHVVSPKDAPAMQVRRQMGGEGRQEGITLSMRRVPHGGAVSHAGRL